MDNRSELTALTGTTNRCRHCEDKTLSITRQKFWYGLSSILVLCLLLVSTALIFQSSSKDCELPKVPDEPVPSITSEVARTVTDPCLTKTGRRKKSKKCREKIPVVQVEPLASRIVGHYRQVELVNMEEYLAAEGGNFMYQRMALTVMPNLEIKKYSEHKFGQIYTAFMYNKEWLMFTDGRKYQIEDALGDEVTAQATDNGEMIEISTTGGSTGPMVTRISLEAETNRLQFELELTDLKVKALRYFEPV